MTQKRYNELVINPECLYKGQTAEKVLGEALKLLTTMNYICTVTEEAGLYIIRYGHADLSFGDYYPFWLTEEEYMTATLDYEKESSDN